MTRLKTTPFDVADYLDDEIVAQEYLREANQDPQVREKAAADVARAAARRDRAS